MIPLMSVTRNFFMGREPVIGTTPFRRMDFNFANSVTREEMHRIGIDVRDPHQAVGTLSGGERQCVAIARAVYFGAKVLILDEPTSALGVAQTSMVLKYIHLVRQKGLGVIFITHNVRHAYSVGDRFTVLNRGKTLGTYAKAAHPYGRSPKPDGRRKGAAATFQRARRHGLTERAPTPSPEGLRANPTDISFAASKERPERAPFAKRRARV